MANDQEEYPEFRALLEKFNAEKAQILAKSAPLRAERDKVVAEIQPRELRHRELTAQIRTIELPRLVELDNRIAALHRAMGARSLQEGARPEEIVAAVPV